ncbi:kinetochore complex Sim4 subunit Fta1-domain-containing protein [Xylariomycetidae sp. FL0641]|nr:kinetochore complex Sim4 subunit Fta1-domain-containing protein [Xylariomycetidae sp. FL0641]
MPPRKRKRAAPEPEPTSAPEGSQHSAPSDGGDEDHDASASSTDPAAAADRFFFFFDTTFATCRASPLYLGAEPLTPARLQTLARRLRDALVGDVVRGVQVGGGAGPESDAALGRAGALLHVDWRWAAVEDLLPGGGRGSREGSRELGSGGGGGGEQETPRRRALCLRLDYENACFGALLLPDLDDSVAPPQDEDVDDDGGGGGAAPPWTWDEAGDTTTTTTKRKKKKGDGDEQEAFLPLPLLLLRMPAPLRAALLGFLAAAFDCRVAPLRLGTRTLVSSWEAWMAGNRRTMATPSKDVAITLGFDPTQTLAPQIQDPSSIGTAPSSVQQPTQPAGLRTLDITIPAREIRRFLRAGENHPPRSPPAPPSAKEEEGWHWLPATPQPFTDALARYLAHHLALDLFHAGVRVQRVACAGFVLGETRVKVFGPGSGSGSGSGGAAVWALLRGLTRKARGQAVVGLAVPGLMPGDG